MSLSVSAFLTATLSFVSTSVADISPVTLEYENERAELKLQLITVKASLNIAKRELEMGLLECEHTRQLVRKGVMRQDNNTACEIQIDALKLQVAERETQTRNLEKRLAIVSALNESERNRPVELEELMNRYRDSWREELKLAELRSSLAKRKLDEAQRVFEWKQRNYKKGHLNYFEFRRSEIERENAASLLEMAVQRTEEVDSILKRALERARSPELTRKSG